MRQGNMPQTALLLLLLLRHRYAIPTLEAFRKHITAEARKRRDRRISRRALQQPSLSPFAFLLASGCVQSLITLKSMEHRAFNYLLQKFAPTFERYTPYSPDGLIRLLPLRENKRGRPRSLTVTQCLGLVLIWGRTRGSDMVLCLLFYCFSLLLVLETWEKNIAQSSIK